MRLYPANPSAAAQEAAHRLLSLAPDFAMAGVLHVHDDIIVAMNPALARLLNTAPTEDTASPWIGQFIWDLELDLTPALWAERTALANVPLAVKTSFRAEPDSATEALPVELLCIALPPTPPYDVLVLVRDRRQEAALEARYRTLEEEVDLLARSSNGGAWSWDLQTGAARFSPRWAELVGLLDVPLEGTIDIWLSRIHPNDRAMVDAALSDHLDGHSSVFDSEHRVTLPDGTWRWMNVRALARHHADSSPSLMAGSMIDITPWKRAEERLIHNTSHDPLTGLGSRNWFIHVLQNSLASAHTASPASPRGAVLLIGVDGFKLINDSFGPTIGDLFLRAVATRLTRAVAPSDVVARIGGDEFVVIRHDPTSADEVEALARAITTDLKIPYDIRGFSIYSAASIGIVLEQAPYTEAEEVLRDASIALLRAKHTARGLWLSFDATMRAEVQRRLLLETDLRRALERGEFTLAFQPIVSLKDGAVLGVEALARWTHPTRGPIGPDQFIPIAEATGLIRPLGRWVLETACHTARALGPSCWVSVNVSGQELTQPGFVTQIQTILADQGVAPSQIHLEITESVLMGNAALAQEVLEQLHALGLYLVIDDFGTGYSSLAYLHSFPLDMLKIDRSFLSDNDDAWAIVTAICSLARALKLAVVAEGVETPVQRNQLQALGCEAAQGYLFSRPVPAPAVADYISKTKVESA